MISLNPSTLNSLGREDETEDPPPVALGKPASLPTQTKVGSGSGNSLFETAGGAKAQCAFSGLSLSGKVGKKPPGAPIPI